MAFFHKSSGREVVGVNLEIRKVEGIRRADNARGWAQYWYRNSWDEVLAADGTPLMATVGGPDVPASEIEWRDE